MKVVIMVRARQPICIVSGVFASGAVISFILSAWLFQWDSRSSQPNRRAAMAILGLLPYSAAVLLG